MTTREFLKKHKALTKFKQAYMADKQSDNPLNPELILDSSPERFMKENKKPSAAILRAFHWDVKVNGETNGDYWNNLHNQACLVS